VYNISIFKTRVDTGDFVLTWHREPISQIILKRVLDYFGRVLGLPTQVYLDDTSRRRNEAIGQNRQNPKGYDKFYP